MRATTIGGATIDTIAIIDSSRIERMKMTNADTSFLLLAEGEKTEASDVSTHCGGGAINTAVALARLGHEVSAVVKLGHDLRADTIIAKLTAENVSARYVLQDAAAMTGASVLVSSHDRNATIFTYRGANALLDPDELDPAAFAVNLVHISSLSNQSANCFSKIINLASKAGAFISVNPGIRQLSSRGGIVLDALPEIDLLIINKVEAAELVPALAVNIGIVEPWSAAGLEVPAPLARQGLSSGGYDLSLHTFLVDLISRGLKYAVVTDGSSGAFLATSDRFFYSPAAKTKIACTAGGGDAFAATIASFLAEGFNPEQALAHATVNAAAVVSRVDTQSGLLKRAELDLEVAVRCPDLQVQSWSNGQI